jgi:uncharacterized membrane protein YphA (DoxX/SURF4 family)
MRAVYGLGRAILGGFFLYNGINHFAQLGPMKGYAAAKQFRDPEMSVKASGALLTAAGASLLLGYKPQAGALGAIGFLGMASLFFHDFWNVQDPQQRQMEQIHFFKNMALLGAAMAILGAE